MNHFADVEVASDVGRLILRGEIDLMAVDDVRAALARAHESNVKTLNVDLSLVDFIDSSGLGVIARAASEFALLRIVAAPISVIRILEMTGLGDLLAIGGDVEGP